MSKLITRDAAAAKAQVHPTLPQAVEPSHQVDRTFELPKRLHFLTAAAYLGFLAVMAVGTMNPNLAIPMVIFAIFIVGFFGVPAIWVRMRPENNSRSLSWSKFLDQGIQTYTGRMQAKDAVLQVLILPVLILAWAIAIVVIRAIIG